MLFRPSGWTITKRSNRYVLTFENQRNMTPDISLSESQFSLLLREALRSIGPDKAQELISDSRSEFRVN